MTKRLALIRRGLLASALALLPLAAPAAPMPQVKVNNAPKACVFDLMGSQGETYALAKDIALQAQREGVSLQFVPYMNEQLAAEDFKAGQCDAVMITNLRARQFNRFVGSIDAIGAVPNEQTLRAVLQLLLNPKSGERMVSGNYEVAGIIPLGAVYPFVDDRSINTLAKAAGKKIAVFDWDRTQAKLVQNIGAQPVSSDIINFASKFNNGQVDIIAAPAIAFRPLELHRGLGNKGAIVNMPFMQITGVLVIRHEKFRPGDGQRLRNVVAGRLEQAFAQIQRAEVDIPSQYWSKVPQVEVEDYFRMMREARVAMTADGEYDPDMMRFLKRVRCRYSPQNEECILDDE
ncbi:MAG TPA: putative solute-binding protein [Moraxellaceae bacterium]|nr:putative solute-binding protein [Moraxellaceae bacterium]